MKTADGYIFKARVMNNAIQVFYAGNWRAVRYYQGKTYPPRNNIVMEAKATFMLNAGMKGKVPMKEVKLDWIA